MTTGRINQVTAFSLRPRAQACSSRTPHGTGYGMCLARPNGTALATARGLDFALLRTEHHTPISNPFTHASSSNWSAMGQSQSAPVVYPCHPRWCGQRLAEPPARCLPGSRPSGWITMLMWPGVRLPCHAR